jgi:hypothetical protein
MADENFDKGAAVARLDTALSAIGELRSVFSTIDSKYRNYKLNSEEDLERALDDINEYMRETQNAIDRIRGRLR